MGFFSDPLGAILPDSIEHKVKNIVSAVAPIVSIFNPTIGLIAGAATGQSIGDLAKQYLTGSILGGRGELSGWLKDKGYLAESDGLLGKGGIFGKGEGIGLGNLLSPAQGQNSLVQDKSWLQAGRNDPASLLGTGIAGGSAGNLGYDQARNLDLGDGVQGPSTFGGDIWSVGNVNEDAGNLVKFVQVAQQASQQQGIKTGIPIIDEILGSKLLNGLQTGLKEDALLSTVMNSYLADKSADKQAQYALAATQEQVNAYREAQAMGQATAAKQMELAQNIHNNNMDTMWQMYQTSAAYQLPQFRVGMSALEQAERMAYEGPKMDDPRLNQFRFSSNPRRQNVLSVSPNTPFAGQYSQQEAPSQEGWSNAAYTNALAQTYRPRPQMQNVDFSQTFGQEQAAGTQPAGQVMRNQQKIQPGETRQFDNLNDALASLPGIGGDVANSVLGLTRDGVRLANNSMNPLPGGLGGILNALMQYGGGLAAGGQLGGNQQVAQNVPQIEEQRNRQTTSPNQMYAGQQPPTGWKQGFLDILNQNPGMNPQQAMYQAMLKNRGMA